MPMAPKPAPRSCRRTPPCFSVEVWAYPLADAHDCLTSTRWWSSSSSLASFPPTPHLHLPRLHAGAGNDGALGGQDGVGRGEEAESAAGGGNRRRPDPEIRARMGTVPAARTALSLLELVILSGAIGVLLPASFPMTGRTIVFASHGYLHCGQTREQDLLAFTFGVRQINCCYDKVV